MIAANGGADSRDFLTKVQVFSFFLNRPPRDCRVTVLVSRRLSHVFRDFPPRSSNASCFGRASIFAIEANYFKIVNFSHEKKNFHISDFAVYFVKFKKKISLRKFFIFNRQSFGNVERFEFSRRYMKCESFRNA